MLNITILNIISWVVFGFIAGTIAHLLDRVDVRGGYLGTIVLGILGAVVGGYLADVFFGIRRTGLFNLTALITAVVGALILSFIYRAIFREKGHIKTSTGRMR